MQKDYITHDSITDAGDIYPSLYRSGIPVNPVADDGLLAGPELESDAELRALGWLKDKEPQPHVIAGAKTAAGLQECLDLLSIAYRWNLRKGALEYRDCGDWTPENDRHAADVRERIAAQCVSKSNTTQPLTFGRDLFADRLNIIAYRNEVDPALEWLESLPAHDGVDRLDRLLHNCFVLTDRADPPELVAWVGRFLVMGAVWRTLHPGAKLDETPVLVGPQGVGKSTLLQSLLPPDATEWFADGLNCLSTDKEFAEALAGRVIVELSEMRGRSLADIDALKARLTRTNDGYHRGAYARHAETQLRRAIIVGTTNSMAALPNDVTGNRRFVPVNIAAGDPADVRRFLDANRDQLWAEALARCQAGENPRLPDDYKDAQTENNERYRSADELLEVWLERWIEQLTADYFLLPDCALAARDILNTDTRRLTNALTKLGWRSARKSIDGKQQRVWTRENS